MNKNDMNPETKELILMTTIFIIYGAIVMLLAFFTSNYMFLILLAPLAFGQSIVKMFRNISNNNNMSKGMNEYSGKFENFKNLYENVYSELDNKALKMKRIGLRILYIIFVVGILSTICSFIALLYIDHMNSIIHSDIFYRPFSIQDETKIILMLTISCIVALIMNLIIQAQKKKYKELYKSEVINQIFKLEGKFEYNQLKNIYTRSQEGVYRSLNFDNTLFNRFEMEDKISRKNKRRISI